MFRLSSLQNTSTIPPPPPVSPAQNPSHRLDTVLMETPQDTLVPVLTVVTLGSLIVVLKSENLVSAGVESFKFRVFKREALIRFVCFLH